MANQNQSVGTRVDISEVAFVVNPSGDNVAVAKKFLSKGTLVAWNGETIELQSDIQPGHRFALRDILAGEPVCQYGQPFGISNSNGIRKGERIHRENIRHELPERSFQPASKNELPDYFPDSCVPSFEGYVRPDGSVGTRNYVLIVPTSMCASHEATQIATIAEHTLFSPDKYPNVSGVSAIPHNRGCGCPDGASVEMVMKVLSRYISHPNVGAALVIQLGCEKTSVEAFATYLQDLALSGQKPVRIVGIQQCGGTRATIERGLQIVAEFLKEADRTRRTPVSASNLVLGSECGGSDAFSGITANPALGDAADLTVRCQGAVVFSEIPEIYGAEHLLSERARDEKVANDVIAAIEWYEKYASAFGHKLDENPSPGNIEGGLVNIFIKSLGAIAKAGTMRLENVIDYADPIRGRGLHLMQGPGNDQESTSGLVAAGCNVVCFTTGRGTTIGNAVCPVIKIASNSTTYRHMKDDIDINAGTILDGTETVQQVGERIFQEVLEVASGKPCKAEINYHREFQIWGVDGISL